MLHGTTLSGDIGNSGDSSDNSYHVVTGAPGATASAVLDGFTITGGNANGSSEPHYFGGGMYNYNSSPTIRNVTFSGNSAEVGGGMYNDNSSPVLTNVTFSGNSAYYGGSGGGGGMYNYDNSSPVLTNVIFSGNSADYGGGMYNDNSSPVLTNVTFSGNSAYDGGGMFNWQSSPVLTNVTFSGNSADHRAGGMYNYNSSPTLTDVTFSDNNANYLGGGMYNDNSSPVLTNVTFSGNSAPYGGGMFNGNSSPVLTNVTFSGNSANGGGGMYNYYYSSPTFTNVTFSGNSAYYEDGGGGMYNNDNSNPILVNVIIANSTHGDCVNNSSSLNANSKNNLIEDTGSNACGLTNGTNGNIIGVDPNLGPLADNGGPTKTHALLAGSPAIDAGTSDGAPDKDQRGVSRPQGSGYDIGAYEYALQYTVTYNGNGATGGSAPTDPTLYSAGSTVTVLGNTGNLVKTNYTFSGWNTAANGTGTDYSAGNTFNMPTLNVTLYAKWTQNIPPPAPAYSLSVTVEDFCNPENQAAGNVKSGDGRIDCGMGGRDCEETYTSEVTVQLTAAAAPGYVFMGWDGAAASCGKNLSCTVSLYASKAVRAVFSKPLSVPSFGVFDEINPAQFYASCDMPIGVGFASKGSGYVDLRVMLPGFAMAMDLYLGIYFPDMDTAHLYIVKPNGDLAPFTSLGPDMRWRSGVMDVFWAQPLSKWYTNVLVPFGIPVPAGRYEFYLLAMPAGSTDVTSGYYLWHTVAVVK